MLVVKIGKVMGSSTSALFATRHMLLLLGFDTGTTIGALLCFHGRLLGAWVLEGSHHREGPTTVDALSLAAKDAFVAVDRQ